MKHKYLLALCLVFSATLCAAAGAPTATLSGEVQEVKQVDSYTYLRIKTATGDAWAAVPKADVKPGARVVVGEISMMSNFESKTLKKTFPSIAFGTLSDSAKTAASGHVVAAKPVNMGSVKVAKATAGNAYTVAETITKAAALKDKTVTVAGKVVKFNAAIMGKNWIHLQDGSGSAAAGSNELLATSQAQAKVGEVITLSGVVRTNQDFGAGYSYKVLLENATVKK